MKIHANSSMNCKSEIVTCCVICPTCKEFYIGQSGKSNVRVRVHKQLKEPSVVNKKFYYSVFINLHMKLNVTFSQGRSFYLIQTKT